MELKEHNGREISGVWWNDDENSSSKYPNDQCASAKYQWEYFGEYAINWIIEYDSNGNEIRRQNIKYVAGFSWK